MGAGVLPDKEEAIRWFHKAARQGHAKAMFNLGAAYYNGDGVQPDDAESYAWFLLSKEAGNSAADDALHRADSEAPKARVAAFKRIAKMYETGEDLPTNAVESLNWFRKGAEAGDVDASVSVASILLASGRQTTPEEFTEARKRCEAAAKFYSPGAYCMAVIYQKGLGLEKNPEEAVKWFHRAAELRNARATLELGEAYWKGAGVKVDLVDAYMWTWISFNLKVPGADQNEFALRNEMKPGDIDRAKKKAADWERQHRVVGLKTGSNPPPPAN
jgi:uncharacterized protein